MTWWLPRRTWHRTFIIHRKFMELRCSCSECASHQTIHNNSILKLAEITKKEKKESEKQNLSIHCESHFKAKRTQPIEDKRSGSKMNCNKIIQNNNNL